MAIYTKLLAVQKALPVIEKDAPNPFYKSKYATLDGILEVLKPILNENGLVLIQPLTNINGLPAIATILVEVESGDIIKEVFPLLNSADAQKQGGTITYTKRQALTAFFAIQTDDDDDGNSLVKPPTPPKATIQPSVGKPTPQATTVATKWAGTLAEAGDVSLTLKGVVQNIKGLTPSGLDWVRNTIKNPQVKSAAQFYYDNVAPF